MKAIKKNNKDLAIIIIAFFLGALLMYLLIGLKSNNTVISKIYDKSSLSSSVEKVYDSVVVIESYTGSSLDSTGTGFFYKKDNKYAYLLTNEHVLSSTITEVTTSTDEKIEATILGRDEYLDLAVLRVDKKYAKQIANLGSSDKMNLGDTIFTVGAPLGINYKGSVTSGVLSGKDRMVQTTIEGKTTGGWLMKVLQIDASINKGNSGGPLLNVNGDVIGICSLKLTDEEIEGMGFAIPIEYAKAHLTELETGKKLTWPELGIKMTDVTNTATLEENDIDIPTALREGVAILDIKKGSSAEKAHLKKGDVIVAINNNNTKNIAYLKYELFQYQVGDRITIKYIRKGKNKTTNTILNSSN